MGCCCVAKKNTKKQKPANEIVMNAIVQPCEDSTKPGLEQAKIWLKESSKKEEEKIEQPPLVEESPPPPPSKRRQLLRDLFRQAKIKQQSQSPQKEHKLQIQKMQTMQSAPQQGQEKQRNIGALQEAIRELIKRNKEELTCCGICTEQYDNDRHLPMMVCMNQHTYCSQCLNDLWKKGHKRCPLDQSPYDINNIQKNRIVLQILSQMTTNK